MNPQHAFYLRKYAGEKYVLVEVRWCPLGGSPSPRYRSPIRTCWPPALLGICREAVRTSRQPSSNAGGQALDARTRRRAPRRTAHPRPPRAEIARTPGARPSATRPPPALHGICREAARTSRQPHRVRAGGHSMRALDDIRREEPCTRGRHTPDSPALDERTR